MATIGALAGRDARMCVGWSSVAHVAANAGIGGAACEGGVRFFNEALFASITLVPGQVLNNFWESRLRRPSPW